MAKSLIVGSLEHSDIRIAASREVWHDIRSDTSGIELRTSCDMQGLIGRLGQDYYKNWPTFRARRNSLH